MITHHPDSRLLNEFASGSLALAQSACVSVHLHFCDRCQRQVSALQEVGAELFDTLDPIEVDSALLDNVLVHLDDEAPLAAEYADHPEADAAVFETRIRVYRDRGYFPPETADDLIAMCRAADVTWPERLLEGFVRRYG